MCSKKKKKNIKIKHLIRSINETAKILISFVKYYRGN